MPELPEVETVRRGLEKELVNRKIVDVLIYYPNIVANPTIEEFKKQIKNQTIHKINRYGKWLIFELDHDVLLSHLRMEGKYFFRSAKDPVQKHEHVVFCLDDQRQLRYHDTRKFGRMYLLSKDTAYQVPPLSNLGLEPWDQLLTVSYLKDKWKNKKIPIKTSLLDQSVIVGIGNIYANEILFLSHISPLRASNRVTKKELEYLIENTRKVLKEAIDLGGSTIRSYHPSEGVDGMFQQKLFVHGKEGQPCPICGKAIKKRFINGRSSYYCTNCQK